MLAYTKWNDPAIYCYTLAVTEGSAASLYDLAAKEGEIIRRTYIMQDTKQSKKHTLLDQQDFAIVENIGVSKYLTFEQIYAYVRMRGIDLSYETLRRKLLKLVGQGYLSGYEIVDFSSGKKIVYYQVGRMGKILAQNRGVMFHKGNGYISFARRERENLPYDTPDDVKRILMGNQIVLGLLRSNAKMLRFGIMETFRAEGEAGNGNDGMFRTAANVKIDEQSVLAYEVVRDTPDACEKLAQKVKRYYLLLHNHARDYLVANFHGDSSYPQFIVCGESLEHNIRIKKYLEEQGLWREEDPILFTEDSLNYGDTLQSIYALEDDNEQYWYLLPENVETVLWEREGA